jgi:hypothetical protein
MLYYSGIFSADKQIPGQNLKANEIECISAGAGCLRVTAG